MLVLGTDIHDLSKAPFSGAPGINGISQRETILGFHPVLIVTILLGGIPISAKDNLRPSSQKRLKLGLCYHAYMDSSGILTGLPFLIHTYWVLS